MLEKQLEAACQPAVVQASRWSELLDHQKVVAFLFLLPTLAVLAVVVYPFFSGDLDQRPSRQGQGPAWLFRQFLRAAR